MDSQNNLDDLNSGVIKFTNQLDLTKEQVITTKNAYRLHAEDYAIKYERNNVVIKRAITTTVDPFLAIYDQQKNHNPILFAGCGSCRDLQYCEEKGYQCFGLDTSRELLNIAKKLGVKSPLYVNDINYYNIVPNSLGGIFCDTALGHTPKRLLAKTLSNFHAALKTSGVLFLSFRQGDGHVYYSIDSFGERYYTTFSKEEAETLIINNGFHIEYLKVNGHPFPDRPKFIAIIATKI